MNGLGGLLVGIAAVLTSLTGLTVVIRRQSSITAKVDEIHAETTPNGGESMRDEVRRIGMTVGGIEQKVDRQAVRVEDAAAIARLVAKSIDHLSDRFDEHLSKEEEQRAEQMAFDRAARSGVIERRGGER